MRKNTVNFIISDDLSIPDFLKIDKRGSKAKFRNTVTIEEDKPQSAFITTTLPPDKPKKPRGAKPGAPSVQEYTRRKASAIIADLEGLIDDGEITPEWSLYSYARKNEWSAPIAKRVADHFTPIANELLEVMSMPQDEDLQYAYRGYGEDNILSMGVMYQGLVDEAVRWADIAKKLKPRKKKLPSVERVLKNFVYAKTDATYQLASIDPVKIIGAQELWVFHPKACVLTVFRALDRGGLNIKRTKITNYNEKTTVAKKIGRKTRERLDDVMTGGKITLRKLMDSVTGKGSKITRITKHHILLRVE